MLRWTWVYCSLSLFLAPAVARASQDDANVTVAATVADAPPKTTAENTAPVADVADTSRTFPLGRKQDFWRFGLGMRVGFVSDPAFDPFAANDALTQVSLDASKTLFTRGRLSFAAGVGWDVGSRSENARGDASSLTVHRLSAPLELRYHVMPWLYGFGKIAPGAVLARASIDDASSSSTLTGGGWAFSCDLSAGASFLLGPHSSPQKKLPRVWMTPEGGYAWSTGIPLHLTPADRGDDPRPVGETNLGTLALRGPFVRLAVAMAF